MDLTAALPTFVVTLREGFEAFLVVLIVLACLKKAQQTQLNSWVYRGIGAGIIASILLGWFFRISLQSLESNQGVYTPIIKQSLEGIFGVVAIAMLSWMLIWMSYQAKSLKGEVEGALKEALNNDNAGKGIFLLVFIAVLREGFETVLFIVAKFEQNFAGATFGAFAGLAMAAFMAFLLYQWGVKINIGLFFKVMGFFLLLIVAGLVLGALKHFDAAAGILATVNPDYAKLCFSGDSCLLGPLVWNATNILPDKQFPGILLKALFGYRDTIYLVQAIAYIIFLVVVGTLYFRSLGDKNLGSGKAAVVSK